MPRCRNAASPAAPERSAATSSAVRYRIVSDASSAAIVAGSKSWRRSSTTLTEVGAHDLESRLHLLARQL